MHATDTPEAVIARLPAELRIKLSIGAMHTELEIRQDRIGVLSAQLAAQSDKIKSLEEEIAALKAEPAKAVEPIASEPATA